MNLLQIIGGVLVISGTGQIIVTQRPAGLITAAIGAFLYTVASDPQN